LPELELFLGPLVAELRPNKAIGIVQSPRDYEVAQALFPEIQIDWRLGDASRTLEGMPLEIDVIVSTPPFGERPTLKTDKGFREIRQEPSNIALLNACSRLSDRGIGFLIVPPVFMFQSTQHGMRDLLEKSGIYLEAVLDIPGNVFTPLTEVRGYLAIVSRQKHSHLFVGELATDVKAQKGLLENLKARKSGEVPQLGALIEPYPFRSVQALVAEYELKSLLDSFALPAVTLSEISVEINGIGVKQTDLENKSNCIYLSPLLDAPVMISRTEKNWKRSGYLQIVLDPNKVDASYIAGFLDTDTGRKIRNLFTRMYGSGHSMGRVSHSSLQKLALPLPSLAQQLAVIQTNSLITDLASRLSTFQSQLWNSPDRVDEIREAIGSGRQSPNFGNNAPTEEQPGSNQGLEFEQWMETLPFPLASILWAYHASAVPQQKTEHLLNFFEAASEFTATLLLSGLVSDRTFYSRVSPEWNNAERFQNWYQKPTFGNWNFVGGKMAGCVRKLLATDDHQHQTAQSLFGNAETAFFEATTTSKLFSLLAKVANEYRNPWKGHTGIVGTHEYEKRLTLLESSLSEFRQIILDRYSKTLIVIPGSSTYHDGIFEYHARAMVGTRPPFREKTIATIVPMDAHKLYLVHDSQLKPVELLPFIRIGLSAKQRDACFFYAGREQDGTIRWVSYHFEDEGEIKRQDREVEAIFTLLQPTGAS